MKDKDSVHEKQVGEIRAIYFWCNIQTELTQASDEDFSKLWVLWGLLRQLQHLNHVFVPYLLSVKKCEVSSSS